MATIHVIYDPSDRVRPGPLPPDVSVMYAAVAEKLSKPAIELIAKTLVEQLLAVVTDDA